MTAARHRIVDRSGQGEYLAAGVGGQATGDQRAAAFGRLHDHGAQGQAGDDPVARREVLAQWRCSRRVFADDGAFGGDARSECVIGFGIHLVQAGGDDGDRAAVIERAAVGGRVDPLRQPATDGETRAREAAAKSPALSRPPAEAWRLPTTAICACHSKSGSPATNNTAEDCRCA
jgi:hypothetical protein